MPARSKDRIRRFCALQLPRGYGSARTCRGSLSTLWPERLFNLNQPAAGGLLPRNVGEASCCPEATHRQLRSLGLNLMTSEQVIDDGGIALLNPKPNSLRALPG